MHSYYNFSLSVCQQKTFIIGHKFSMVIDRAFIFHKCIPWGKTFGTNVKVKYQGHNFKKNGQSRGICVSQTHIVYISLNRQWSCYIQQSQELHEGSSGCICGDQDSEVHKEGTIGTCTQTFDNKACFCYAFRLSQYNHDCVFRPVIAPPGWLSGECVLLMTWWLWV